MSSLSFYWLKWHQLRQFIKFYSTHKRLLRILLRLSVKTLQCVKSVEFSKGLPSHPGQNKGMPLLVVRYVLWLHSAKHREYRVGYVCINLYARVQWQGASERKNISHWWLLTASSWGHLCHYVCEYMMSSYYSSTELLCENWQMGLKTVS